MNNLQIFNNPEFGQIRTVVIDNEPWFVGKDVAEILGYTNTKDALAKHIDEEDKIMGSQNATPSIQDSLGRTQYPTWVNESGLYSLILSSKMPNAKKFKHWVTSEVLPAIRKTGSYNKPEQLSHENYIKILDIVSNCDKDRLPCIYAILHQMGFQMNQAKPTRINISDEISDFFESADVVGRVNNEVYSDYVDYCTERDITPMSIIAFSKCVNRVFDTHVIVKKVKSQSRRVYMR